jgi:hypothetical protein
MKKVTTITTTEDFDTTDQMIDMLNREYIIEHFCNNLVFIASQKANNIFECSPVSKWERYNKLAEHTASTQERHDYLLEVLPPIYLSRIDGVPVKAGIACSEAYSHTSQDIVVLDCAYMDNEGNYKECQCVVFNSKAQGITDTYEAQYSRGNIGITYTGKNI